MKSWALVFAFLGVFSGCVILSLDKPAWITLGAAACFFAALLATTLNDRVNRDRILKKELLATVEERDQAETRLAELERMLAEAPIVYGCVHDAEKPAIYHDFQSEEGDTDATHTARLVDIKKIKEDACGS